MTSDARARGRLLEAWEAPVGAGDPVGVLATTFTFEAGFFEEELLARFLAMESGVDDGRAYLIEREERLGRIQAVVLADRRYGSRSTTLAWDCLPVPVPGGACQHAKIALLAWERRIRLLIGSANLTEPAYRDNLEGYAVLDFHDEGDVPRAVLTEALDFLRRMVQAVPDPQRGSGDSPRGRALSLLESVDRVARRIEPGSVGSRGTVTPVPVFVEPPRPESVLAQMGRAWGPSTRPNLCWLLAPFWTGSASGEPGALIDAVVAEMARNGLRELELMAPGERIDEDTWTIELPAAYAAVDLPRVDVLLRPVPLRQGDHARPLHAKGLWWGRQRGRRRAREALLIGSSNMTRSGLGLGGAPPNWEANLCYVTRRNTKVARWFDAAWPDHADGEDVRATGRAASEAEEGGRVPPVPAFFGWATLERRPRSEGWVVRLGLAGPEEPEAWSLSIDGHEARHDRVQHDQAGRPPIVELPLPLGEQDAPPTLVRIRWRAGGKTHEGVLPINARGSRERSRPELWAEVGIDTLLEVLASGGATWRALRRVLRRREKQRSTHRPHPEIDPHRKVDTHQFLLPRIRRISRALEGLQERLARPVHSRAALDWRFDGPLSPGRLAELFLESGSDAEEQGFLLAELALTVRRARQRVRSPGLPRARVHEAFDACLRDLEARLPRRKRSPLLSSYLDKVFEGGTP